MSNAFIGDYVSFYLSFYLYFYLPTDEQKPDFWKGVNDQVLWTTWDKNAISLDMGEQEYSMYIKLLSLKKKTSLIKFKFFKHS